MESGDSPSMHKVFANRNDHKPSDLGVNFPAKSNGCKSVVVTAASGTLAGWLGIEHGKDSAYLKEPTSLRSSSHAIA
jgi:hypothetical protein